MEEEGRWANLSNDILALILNRLHTQSDLCRFRSICKSWRSYASSSPDPQPLFPLALPSLHPNSPSFSLSPTLVYILSLYPNPTPDNPNDNVWLVKVSETRENQWALLNPLTKHKLYFPSGVSWNRINLLGFGNCEVGRSYKLQLVVGDGVEGAFNFEEFSPSIALRKVAVKTGDEFVVLVLYGYGEIALWKSGDENWKIIETGQKDEKEKKQDFDDVICFNRKFYAVDRRGRLAVIDPMSFELDEVIPAMEDCNGQYTYLVESNFRLHLVNKIVNPRPVTYYDKEEEEWVVDNASASKPLGFKVFVFDEREKCWERVNSLGDRVLFVSRDAAFSVCAEQLGWSEGNCIYFEGLTGYDDEADMGFGLNAGVYRLDDQAISIFSSLTDPLTKIFWPPSCWFVQNEDYMECEMQGYLSDLAFTSVFSMYGKLNLLGFKFVPLSDIQQQTIEKVIHSPFCEGDDNKSGS